MSSKIDVPQRPVVDVTDHEVYLRNHSAPPVREPNSHSCTNNNRLGFDAAKGSVLMRDLLATVASRVQKKASVRQVC